MNTVVRKEIPFDHFSLNSEASRLVFAWLKSNMANKICVLQKKKKLSRHLPNCTMSDLFQDSSLAFFRRLTESEISEQVSRQVVTGEPNSLPGVSPFAL